MTILRKIDTRHPAYDRVEQLFLSAFPEDERRELSQQRENINNEPRFELLLAESESQGVGFITLWQFATFIYVEHFAIFPEARNGGLGSKIISEVVSQEGKPVVLEVEMPADDFARRRIEFYKRNGFSVLGYPYVQPAYRTGGNELPMLLMSSAPVDASAVAETLRREVYKK